MRVGAVWGRRAWWGARRWGRAQGACWSGTQELISATNCRRVLCAPNTPKRVRLVGRLRPGGRPVSPTLPPGCSLLPSTPRTASSAPSRAHAANAFLISVTVGDARLCLDFTGGAPRFGAGPPWFVVSVLRLVHACSSSLRGGAAPRDPITGWAFHRFCWRARERPRSSVRGSVFSFGLGVRPPSESACASRGQTPWNRFATGRGGFPALPAARGCHLAPRLPAEVSVAGSSPHISRDR